MERTPGRGRVLHRLPRDVARCARPLGRNPDAFFPPRAPHARREREKKTRDRSRTAVFFPSLFPPPGATPDAHPPPAPSNRPPAHPTVAGAEVCARVVDTSRVSCAVSEVATVEGTSASRDAPRRLDRRGGRAEKASTPARHAPRRFPSLLPLPEKDTFPVAAPLLPPLRSPSPIDPFSFPRRSAPLRPASDRGRRPRVHQRPPPPRGDGDGDG